MTPRGIKPIRRAGAPAQGRVALIARCPEHGLHGERQTCFECDGPVEQVGMVPIAEVLALLQGAGHPVTGSVYDAATLVERAFEVAR